MVWFLIKHREIFTLSHLELVSPWIQLVNKGF
jgi:hypothetical protein